MKISKDLLDKINKAETVEEKTKIIDMAGLQLSDEELEAVVGGFGLRDAVTVAIAATAIGMVTPLPAHAQEAVDSQIEYEDDEYEDDYEEDDYEEDDSEENDYEEDDSEDEEYEEDESEEAEYDDESKEEDKDKEDKEEKAASLEKREKESLSTNEANQTKNNPQTNPVNDDKEKSQATGEEKQANDRATDQSKPEVVSTDSKPTENTGEEAKVEETKIEESKIEEAQIDERGIVVNETSQPASYNVDMEEMQDGEPGGLHLAYAGTQDYMTPEEVAEYIRQQDESQEYEHKVKVYMEQWEEDRKEEAEIKKEEAKIKKEEARQRAGMDWEIPESEKSKTTKELEKVGKYANPSGYAVDETIGKALKKTKMDKDAARLVTDVIKDAAGLIPGVGDAATVSDISIHASMLKDAKTTEEKALQGVVIVSKTTDLVISKFPFGTALVGAKSAVLSLSKFCLKKIFF